MTQADPNPPDQALDPLRRREALLAVAEAIARHDDLSDLLRDLVRRLPEVVPFDFLVILLYDEENEMMRLHLIESLNPESIRRGPDLTPLESPGGMVWRTREPLVIEDYQAEIRFPVLQPVWKELGFGSGCYLPLSTPSRCLGALNFARRCPRAYLADDLEFLNQVARQVAVAVDRALHAAHVRRLQGQLESERDRLRLLLEVTNAVVGHLDLRELIRAAAGSVQRVIPWDYTTLVLNEPETQGKKQLRIHTLVFPSGKGLLKEEAVVPFEEAPSSLAILRGQPMVLNADDLERFDTDIARTLLAEGVRSLCCAPLTTHSGVLGTLNVARTREEVFKPTEVELFAQVAGQVALAVENALAYRQIGELKERLALEKTYLEDEIRQEHGFAEIVGQSPLLEEVLRRVRIVAPTTSTVLITGETGTGKELIARAIHQLSRREERTFVKLNCAAIPTGLLESELFGHEKGAFTGAVARKIGRFELANGGTLFLDEVGDIPPELQPKLLRVLQEQEFERLGSTQTVRVDVRLVAATNRDLARMVADREYRTDLYYRLNVFPLHLPPLRERAEDIPLLVRHFVQEYARKLNKPIRTIPDSAMSALVRYPWPGNIRELQNFIERSVLLSSGSELQVAVDDLLAPTTASNDVLPLQEAERRHILAALERCNWVLGGPSGAAALLGMNRTTLQSRMQKLNIRRPR